MPGGFALLGNALGGNSEQSYQEGRAMGAKTEDALASARRRVMENDALARGRQSLVAAGVPDEIADAAYTSLTAGGKLDDPIQVMLQNQQFNFRKTAGDPTTSAGDANAALRGVASGPVEPLYKIGGGYAHKFGDTDTVTPLPGGADGGGESAGIQALRAFGFIGPDGRVIPGMERQAFNVYRDTTRNVDAAGVPYQTNNNPFDTGAPTQVVPTPVVVGNKFSLASAGEQGVAQGKSAAGLPDSLADIAKMRENITGFLAQPGFAGVYGNVQGQSAVAPIAGLLDQDIANARAALSQLDAQSFGVSIQNMKGLGQLSNAEGLKVTQAFTRATNPTISEPEAQAAWQEVLAGLDLAEQRAKVKAGQGAGTAPAAPAAPATPAGEVKMIGGKKYVKVNGQWFEDDGT